MKKLNQRHLDAQHRIFSLLSNLNRLRLLNVLQAAKKPMKPLDLAKATGINDSIVYESIKMLRSAGIVKPVKKTRTGPFSQAVELTQDDRVSEFLSWTAGAVAFKDVCKAPKERARLQLVDDRIGSFA